MLTSDHQSSCNIKGNRYEDTGRICRRCKARVWKSNNPEYSFHCFACDENLYEFETEPVSELNPIVEGTKEDGGFWGTDTIDEYCPFCEEITYNAPISRVSLCAHCRAELFPCAGCEQQSGCQWSSRDFACQHFTHSEKWKEKERT